MELDARRWACAADAAVARRLELLERYIRSRDRDTRLRQCDARAARASALRARFGDEHGEALGHRRGVEKRSGIDGIGDASNQNFVELLLVSPLSWRRRRRRWR